MERCLGEGNGKKTPNQMSERSHRCSVPFGQRAGGYLREDGLKVGCRDFLKEKILHVAPVHEGDHVVAARKRVFCVEHHGGAVRSLLLLPVNQVADQVS